MTTHEKRRFTVISNDSPIKDLNYIKEPDSAGNPVGSEGFRTKELSGSSGGQSSFHSNPMYEKLLTYKALQQKKKFTVDDLLKW